MIQSRVSGTGTYLPEKILSNFDLEKMVDTSSEWIIERTGISERRIASPQEQTSDLALEASKKALETANLDAKDLDFILVATVPSGLVMPSTACILQNKLGASKDCGALDVSAACAGFVYGMSIADQMVKGGLYKNILIVGSEIISRITNYKDRGTCILFGDGAGAMILSATDKSESKSKILGHNLKSDGSLGYLLTLKLSESTEAFEDKQQYIKMEGRDIFKNAIRTMASCCDDVLKQTDFPLENIDWLVPHQANIRIIESVAKKFDFPMDKVVLNIEKTGNNSSATIPIALDLAIRDGRIKRDQYIMFTTFGGGLTSGSLLMRY